MAGRLAVVRPQGVVEGARRAPHGQAGADGGEAPEGDHREGRRQPPRERPGRRRRVLEGLQPVGSKKARKKKASLPAVTSVTEYGNRTNAIVAFGQWKAADKKARTLYGATSTRYTVSFTQKIKGKKVKFAATVVRYADVIVTGVCMANANNQPKASSVRTCSKRLANAQVKKATPLFRNDK